MEIREARVDDYTALHHIRMAVNENVLSNPGLVTEVDYTEMLTQKGKGWVAIIENTIVGFAIVDISTLNIWALFILPEYEKQGIGKRLFGVMVDWSFQQPIQSLWLSTSPGTRAEGFYEKAGWEITGITSTGENRFEITREKFTAITKS